MRLRTSYEKLVTSPNIFVANKYIKLIIKNHINIKSVGVQMIHKALILLFKQLLCQFKRLRMFMYKLTVCTYCTLERTWKIVCSLLDLQTIDPVQNLMKFRVKFKTSSFQGK